MSFTVVLLNVVFLVCNFCFFTAYANTTQPEVLAIRLEKTDAKSTYSEDGIVTLEAERDNRLQFIGIGINEGTMLKLTTEKMEYGTDCDERNGTIPVMETAELQLKSEGILLLKQKDFKTAIVEWSDSGSVERARDLLCDVHAFDQRIEIEPSKKQSLSAGRDGETKLWDGTNAFQDFTESRRNRVVVSCLYLLNC